MYIFMCVDVYRYKPSKIDGSVYWFCCSKVSAGFLDLAELPAKTGGSSGLSFFSRS
jgi:hypothetical protein